MHPLNQLMCVLLAAFLSNSAAAASLPDIIERIAPAVVGVGTARPVKQPLAKGPPVNFLGTGFAVKDGRHVITNYHVLPQKLDSANRESYAVFSGRGKGGKIHQATLVASDPQHDLALLKIVDGPLDTLDLAPATTVREGEAVALTGFPIGVVLGLYPVTHRGIVSAVTPIVIPARSSGTLTAAQLARMRRPFEVYQLDATAYPGNSGSPVYMRDSGEVIGVLNSVLVKETKESVLEKPSGISYAIPVKYVTQLLKEAGIQ